MNLKAKMVILQSWNYVGFTSGVLNLLVTKQFCKEPLLKPIFLKVLFSLVPISGLIPFLMHTIREGTSDKRLFFSPYIKQFMHQSL